MSQTRIYYRLRIRDEADATDIIVLSSHPGDTNALLCEAPDGEGQSIDPIMGTLEVGSYTWQAIDRFDGGDTYTITALLADVDARNQLLSHRAIGEYSNDGSSWSALHTGFLNDIKLSDASSYTFIVGDSDRRERDAVLFKTITDQFDRVSNIIGGPVEAATPVAYNGTPTRAWGPIIDYGPARMQVIANPSGLITATNRVTLSLTSANLPPLYPGQQGSWSVKLPGGLKWSLAAEYIDQLAYPFFEDDATGAYATNGSQQSQPWGSFPQIEVKMTKVSDSSVVKTFPIAQATRKASSYITFPGGPDSPKGDEKALVANSNDWLIVAWDTATMGAQPSVGTNFDVLVRPLVISDANPLHLGGHPVDLHIAANEQEGIPYDSASADATKTALGPLWYELRITGEQEYSKFTEMLKGSAGYAVRYNADGEQEFFPTRATQPDEVATITTADIVGDEHGEPKDVIFRVSESSAIKGVDFKVRSFRMWSETTDEGDRPIDGIVEQELTINGSRRDDSVKGSKIVTYDVPGMIMLEGGATILNQPLALRNWIIQAGDVIIDRAGWGWAEGDVEVFATVAGKVGDYWDLEHPAQVNAKVGQSPVGQRGGTRKVQITKLVEMPGTRKATVKDAGNIAQDPPEAGDSGVGGDPTLPIPELSLAPSVASPFTIATVTETNVSEFSDISADTELQYLVQTATPVPTDDGAFFGPLQSSTGTDTIDAPGIASGETIWVRGRAKLFNGQRGDWSDWISITLGPDDEGSGGTLAPFLLALSIDDTGVLSAEATSTVAEIITVYFLAGAAGGAAPAFADVLATTTVDSSGPPFTAASLATMAEGEVRTVGAIGEDALGNRTTLVLASITRAVNTGAAEGTPGNLRITFHAGPPRVFRNIDSALAEPAGMKGWRKSENTGAIRSARLQHNCYSASGGDLALHLVYSLDKFATSPIETGVFVRANRVQFPEIGDYLPLDPLAVGDNVTLGVATKSGDGAMTLKTENVYLDAVSSDTPPPSPVATPGTIPQGGALGNLILDLDAEGPLMDSLAYADNADVASWPDETTITGDAAPYFTGGTQSAPKFHTSGFAGGSLPCVRVSSGVQGVAFPIPTGGDCTFIFAVGAMSGAGSPADGGTPTDAPLIITHSANNQNGFIQVCSDGSLFAGVNVGSFGNPSKRGSTVVSGPTAKHLVRLSVDKSNARWHLFIDGVLEVEAGPLAILTNTWAGLARMYIGNVLTVDGIAVDYGRVVCYDAAQNSAGLNAAELFLQAIWGTP